LKVESGWRLPSAPFPIQVTSLTRLLTFRADVSSAALNNGPKRHIRIGCSPQIPEPSWTSPNFFAAPAIDAGDTP
jgi:hypothetical protein